MANGSVEDIRIYLYIFGRETIIIIIIISL